MAVCLVSLALWTAILISANHREQLIRSPETKELSTGCPRNQFHDGLLGQTGLASLHRRRLALIEPTSSILWEREGSAPGARAANEHSAERSEAGEQTQTGGF
jgi:hypothetical protein